MCLEEIDELVCMFDKAGSYWLMIPRWMVVIEVAC
jgi:hypothetical protein